jgi:hypothetical protein
MAKEKVYVKLGPKANSFSCPTTGFSLVKQGEVKELISTVANSKKVEQALRGGHIVYAKDTEFDAQGEEANNAPILDRPFLESKTKAVLVPMAIDLLEEDDEEDVADIEAMKKPELVDFILTKSEKEQE